MLVEWAVGQAREVGAARGLEVQQIDTGAFADDERQHDGWPRPGFARVRTWWQMSRPVTPDEVGLVPSTRGAGRTVACRSGWSRPARRQPDEETCAPSTTCSRQRSPTTSTPSRRPSTSSCIRLREDPGHRWDHWWLAGGRRHPVGALVGTPESTGGPDGSYVAYIGVIEPARGRGVAKGLLRTVIADAAARGRDRVTLEVDADSSTGADRLYLSMGWETSYVTESWHRDVPVG